MNDQSDQQDKINEFTAKWGSYLSRKTGQALSLIKRGEVYAVALDGKGITYSGIDLEAAKFFVRMGWAVRQISFSLPMILTAEGESVYKKYKKQPKITDMMWAIMEYAKNKKVCRDPNLGLMFAEEKPLKQLISLGLLEEKKRKNGRIDYRFTDEGEYIWNNLRYFDF